MLRTLLAAESKLLFTRLIVAVTILHRKFRLIVDLRAVLISSNVDYFKTKFIESGESESN